MNANYSAGCLLELSADELQETCDVRGEHGLALIDRWWRLATIVARQPIGVCIELHILGRKPQKLPWSVHRSLRPRQTNIARAQMRCGLLVNKALGKKKPRRRDARVGDGRATSLKWASSGGKQDSAPDV